VRRRRAAPTTWPKLDAPLKSVLLNLYVFPSSFQEQCCVNVLQVVPAESRHELLKNKVEVRLRKAAPATWPKLEAGAAAPVATNFSDPALAHPPSYPSSARCAVSP